MIRRVGAAIAVAACLAGCSSAKTVHLTAGVDPYDLQAAKLCKAFEVFAQDAKANKTSVDDSNALDNAEKAIRTGHDPATAKWAPLVANIDSVLLDAGKLDATDIPAIGIKIGQQCDTIPPLARKAGKYP